MEKHKGIFGILLLIIAFSLTATASARGEESEFLKAFRKAYNVNIGVKEVIEKNRDLVPGEIRGLLEESHGDEQSAEQREQNQFMAETMARVYKNVTGDISYLIEVKRDIFNARLHAPVNTVDKNGVHIVAIPRITAKEKNVFKPDNIIIQAGERVKWINNANESHILASMPLIGKQVLFTSGIKPGQSWTEHFVESGEYYYFCFIHNSMVGKITVLSADKDSVLEKKGSVGVEHEMWEKHGDGEEHLDHGGH